MHSGNPQVSATSWAEGDSLLTSFRGSGSRHLRAYIFVTTVFIVLVLVLLVLLLLLLLSFVS